MDGHDDLVTALTPFIDLLDRLGVTWYVGGSVASKVHGRFRATNDIDVIADLREQHAVAVREALEADHYVDEETIREAVRHRSSFNLVHFGTGLKIDVFVAPDSGYETSVRARRIKETTPATSRFSSVEIASALARRCREGRLDDSLRHRLLRDLDDDLDSFYLVELMPEVVRTARELLE